MSTVARPRGPLPARVYWTRRLALLTLVVLLGWLMIRWIDGGDSGATPPDDEAPAAASQETDDDPAESQGDPTSKDRVRSPRIRTVAESFERPSDPCDLTKVVVAPTVADPSYAGEPVRLTLRISSASSSACSLAIDADHLLVSITSGRDVVWDSTRCEDAIPARELALQPRWSALVDLTWSGQYSGRHCAPDASAAEPGTYTMEAAVLEGEPTEAEVELVERPEPPEDDSDESDDKGSGKGDTGDDSDTGDEGDTGGETDKGDRGDGDRPDDAER